MNYRNRSFAKKSFRYNDFLQRFITIKINYYINIKEMEEERSKTIYAVRTLSRKWNDSICIENTSSFENVITFVVNIIYTRDSSVVSVYINIIVKLRDDIKFVERKIRTLDVFKFISFAFFLI